MKKYNVYGNWGSRFVMSTDNEQEAWDAIGHLWFGEGFVVTNELGETRGEFIPY